MKKWAWLKTKLHKKRVEEALCRIWIVDEGPQDGNNRNGGHQRGKIRYPENAHSFELASHQQCQYESK